jgi:hypothetical protein
MEEKERVDFFKHGLRGRSPHPRMEELHFLEIIPPGERGRGRCGRDVPATAFSFSFLAGSCRLGP